MFSRSQPFLARATPSGGGGGSVEIAGSGQSQPGFGGNPTALTAPVPAGAATGDRILVILRSSEAVTSMTDNQGTTYSALTIASAGAEDRVFLSAPLGGTVPTTISISLAANAFLEKADVFVLTGASATVGSTGTFSTGFATGARNHDYTTPGANSFAFGVIDFTGGGVTGAGSADGAHTWLLQAGSGYQHTFGVLRATAGSYSASLAPLTSGSASSGYWFTLDAA